MNTQYTLFLCLLLIFVSTCSKESAHKPCPASQDYGLVKLTDEALAFIPDSYRNNEKLIFKNAEGQTFAFFPTQDTINRATGIRSSVRWCGESGTVETNVEVERLSAGYRSSEGYGFGVRLGTALDKVDSEEEQWRNVFVDVLELLFTESAGNNGPSSPLCWVINIPVSFRGEAPYDFGLPYPSYTFQKELLIGGRLYSDVYVAQCESGIRLVAQKHSGVVAFTDSEGVDWVLERTESFEEEVASNLVLPDTSGQVVPLSEVEGRLILVDFWASWCEPCRVETEETLKPLYEQYADKGLSIYSVSLDTDREAWVEAIVEDEMIWHQVSDLRGYNSPVFIQYQIYGIPTIYVIDEQRNIRSKNMRGEELKQFVADYLD